VIRYTAGECPPWPKKLPPLQKYFKNDRRWCSFPSKEFTKQDSSKGYSPLLEWATKEAGYDWQDQVRPLAEKAFGL
jgi:hypothetical protein